MKKNEVIQYFTEMKEYDSIMIECKDKKVTLKSMVCISPFNTKTHQWLCGLMIITDMNTAINQRLSKVSKDKNVEDFMEKYYKNSMIGKKNE